MSDPLNKSLLDLTAELRDAAGKACVKITGGDVDKARTLWKLITADHGGYMPAAAALTLVRVANIENLVPDVEPDLSKW